MRVLGFGSYDARVHPRVNVLLEGLAAHGAEVDELTATLRLDTMARVRMLKNPLLLPQLAWRLATVWAKLAWGSLQHRGDRRPDVVLVGYMGHFDVHLARLLFPRSTVVLDHLIFAGDTAADRGATGALLQRALRMLDRAALRSADVVVVDTPEHAALVPSDIEVDVVVAPVGAHPAWFDAGLEGANREVDWPLRVVFFGLYTPLQGAITIGRALARLTAADNVEVLMIGGGQQLAAAREAAGESSFVHWVDWVAPEALPATVASQDVALGIFGDGPKAMRVVPNKVYQSAAAGCAVVTSDSVPQRRALGEEAIFVPPADDEALAAVLRHLGRNAALVGKYRSAARGRASQFFGPAAVTAGLAAQLERHS